MRGRELFDEGGDLFHHGVIVSRDTDGAAITFGERDDADRQRRPADDVRLRRPAPAGVRAGRAAPARTIRRRYRTG